MIETIKISHTVCGETQSCEFSRDAIKLDEALWEWLQSAMVGIGFDAGMVDKFFNGEYDKRFIGKIWEGEQ